MMRVTNDLINRDYVRQLILMVMRRRITKAELHDFEDLLQMIEKAPEVDAIRVIRCRDCAFGKVYADYAGNVQMRCILTELETVPTGYCQHGEEKTDGGAS